MPRSGARWALSAVRLLFLTPQWPFPPTGGAAIRNSHLIAGLAARHEVTLLTFAPPAHESSVVSRQSSVTAPPLTRVSLVPAPRRTFADRLHTLLLSTRPDLARRLYTPAFAAALERLLQMESYDWIVVEGLEMAPYVYERRLPGGVRWLYDAHNAEYLLQARAGFSDLRASYQPRAAVGAAYSLLQWRRLHGYERAVCRAADAVTAVSPADRAALRRLVPGLPVAVVPNGVDLTAWSRAAVAAGPPGPPGDPLLVFDGTMDFRPNVDAARWFCATCWPRIRAAYPHARLALVGRDPAPAVQALATLPGVQVTGAVPDPRPWVAAATVYVVPMRMGGGVRLKLLQALALGCAVVSTRLGAEGVALQPGRDLLVADSPATFSAAVLALLADPVRRTALGAAARAAAARYAWPRIVPRFEAVLTDEWSVVSDQWSVTSGQWSVISDESSVVSRQSSEAEAQHAALGTQHSALSTRPDTELKTQNSKLKTSVVVTVRNEAESIGGLIDSLRAQTRPPDEVVIVDGGSTDGTVARLRAAAADAPWPLRVLERPGANISQGRNAAIRAARFPIIAATDAGVRLAPGWLAALSAPFAAPVGAPVDVAAGFFAADPQTVFERALGATVLPALVDIRSAGFLPSSRSIAFRKTAWASVGGYPEWLDYCEDLVFDLSLRRQGCRFVFVPAAVALFRPRPSLRAFARQYYLYARGDGKADLWRKRHAIRYATYLAAPALTLLARRRPALGLLLAGGAAAYCAGPVRRLRPWLGDLGWGQRLAALALVPLIRITGDGAKMVGYPVGVIWRLRRGRVGRGRNRANDR